jgi:hypothetical protein
MPDPLQYRERATVLAALTHIYGPTDALDITNALERSWEDCEETDDATTIRQALEEMSHELLIMKGADHA